MRFFIPLFCLFFFAAASLQVSAFGKFDWPWELQIDGSTASQVDAVEASAGGVVIAFVSGSRAYASHVTSGGGWRFSQLDLAPGLPADVFPNGRIRIAKLGGNYFAVWARQGGILVAQKFDEFGSRFWGNSGKQVYSGPGFGTYSNFDIEPTPAGGIVVFLTREGGSSSVLAKLDSNGNQVYAWEFAGQGQGGDYGPPYQYDRNTGLSWGRGNILVSGNDGSDYVIVPYLLFSPNPSDYERLYVAKFRTSTNPPSLVWEKPIGYKLHPYALSPDGSGGALLGYGNFVLSDANPDNDHPDNVGYAKISADGTITRYDGTGDQVKATHSIINPNNDPLQSVIRAARWWPGYGSTWLWAGYSSSASGFIQLDWSNEFVSDDFQDQVSDHKFLSRSMTTHAVLASDEELSGGKKGAFYAYELPFRECFTGDEFQEIRVQRVKGDGTYWTTGNPPEGYLLLAASPPGRWNEFLGLYNSGAGSAIVLWNEENVGLLAQRIIESATPSIPPNADADGPYSGYQGRDVQLYGSGSDPDGGSIMAWEWSVDAGGGCTFIPDNLARDPKINCANPGNWKLGLRVQDNEGTWSHSSCSSLNIIARPPPRLEYVKCEADLSGSFIGCDALVVGETITRMAAKCNDNNANPPGTITEVKIGLSNPSGLLFNASPTSQFSDLYFYDNNPDVPLTAGVWKAHGFCKNDAGKTAALEIPWNPAGNQPPIAEAGDDQTKSVGEVMTLDGSASYDTDGVIVSFSWSVVDENGEEISPPDGCELQDNIGNDPTATLSCDSPQVLRIQLKVRDDDNVWSDADFMTATFVAGNQPPVAVAEDASGTAGDTLILSGSNSHDDDGTITSYSWTRVSGDFTGCSEPSGMFVADLQVRCPTAGDRVYELVVTDDDSMQSLPAQATAFFSSLPVPPPPTPSPGATFLYLSCPRLTPSNETNVSVQCLNQSLPCNPAAISLTGAPNRFLGQDGFGFVYSVETVLEGQYRLQASAEGVGSSSCTIARVGVKSTSVPETHPLAVLLLLAGALLLVRRGENTRHRK